MTRKKVATTIYITSDQDRLLKLLSQSTGMPMAELIRQGIDHILDTYKDRLPTQLGLFGEPLSERPPATSPAPHLLPELEPSTATKSSKRERRHQ